MDFKIRIPCSVFLITTSITSEEFAELLASNELTAKDDIVCEKVALSQVGIVLYF